MDTCVRSGGLWGVCVRGVCERGLTDAFWGVCACIGERSLVRISRCVSTRACIYACESHHAGSLSADRLIVLSSLCTNRVRSLVRVGGRAGDLPINESDC